MVASLYSINYLYSFSIFLYSPACPTTIYARHLRGAFDPCTDFLGFLYACSEHLGLYIMRLNVCSSGSAGPLVRWSDRPRVCNNSLIHIKSVVWLLATLGSAGSHLILRPHPPTPCYLGVGHVFCNTVWHSMPIRSWLGNHSSKSIPSLTIGAINTGL